MFERKGICPFPKCFKKIRAENKRYWKDREEWKLYKRKTEGLYNMSRYTN